MSDDPHPWARSLDSLYDQVWTRLIRGVHDRRAAARHPTLATVSSGGKPQARTVVLRAADRDQARLEIHTDRLSAKIGELGKNPMAEVHVWDARARLQIRLQAEVSIQTGPEVDAIWERVPEGSRLSYGGNPAPGQPIKDALAYQKAPERTRFAVLGLAVLTMDILHLGPDHRRASFCKNDGWKGQWLAP